MTESEEKKVEEILKLARANCLHTFNKGVVVEDVNDLWYPSAVFTCTKCNGYIRLMPDTSQWEIKYKELK